MWVETDVGKELLRVIESCALDDEVCSKAMQCLINLTVSKTWIERLCDINVGRRIFSFLTQNVKPTSDSVRTNNAQLVKTKLTEEGGETDFYEI